jgi:hypothetical protein
LGVLALAGCAPPAPRVPMACPHIPLPPGQNTVWTGPPKSGFRQILRPGYWDWQDGNYTWVPAQWMTLLVPGAPRWKDGFWTPNNGVCVWHRAHFILPAPPAPSRI